MFPLSTPPKIRPTRAIVKLVENPTIRRDIMVPKQPRRRTGLRPMRSESAPHSSEQSASEKEKDAIRMPAQKEGLGMPNCLVMIQA
jgi:hypothetical protein